MFNPGMGIELGEELLLKTNVAQYRASFDLIHHPAFLSYAVDFHQRVSVNRLNWCPADKWIESYLLRQI